MCTLAIYLNVFSRYPVVIAANRDEYLARPSSPPAALSPDPLIIGGRDLQAGGTWLGLNEFGLIAGLLNRRSGGEARAGARSRGLLCLDVLHSSNLAQARDFLRTCDGESYNYFNLLIAARDGALVAYNRNGRIELVSLEPGLHLLTNLDIDDFECPRISGAFRHFSRLADNAGTMTGPADIAANLGRLLSDHSTQLDSRAVLPNPLCLHMGDYGTRSSSVLMLGRDDGETGHFFADGPPCVTPYAPALVPAVHAKDGRPLGI